MVKPLKIETVSIVSPASHPAKATLKRGVNESGRTRSRLWSGSGTGCWGSDDSGEGLTVCPEQKQRQDTHDDSQRQAFRIEKDVEQQDVHDDRTEQH